jgi:hypothetical protein
MAKAWIVHELVDDDGRPGVRIWYSLNNPWPAFPEEKWEVVP